MSLAGASGSGSLSGQQSDWWTAWRDFVGEATLLLTVPGRALSENCPTVSTGAWETAVEAEQSPCSVTTVRKKRRKGLRKKKARCRCSDYGYL